MILMNKCSATITFISYCLQNNFPHLQFYFYACIDSIRAGPPYDRDRMKVKFTPTGAIIAYHH
jgi:hypothetical protein